MSTENPVAVVESTAATQTNALMAIIERAATNPDMDVAKLQALLDVKMQWEADEARKAFVVALAAFKARPPKVVKNKHVGFTSKNTGESTDYWHATLDTVCAALAPALSAQGLSYRWETQQLDKGLIRVTCILQHVLGHAERTALEGVPDASGKKNAIQQVGSTVTYLQRYTLLAATGIAVAGQDDDARGADAPAKAPETPQARLDELEKAYLACKDFDALQDLWNGLGKTEKRDTESWKAEAKQRILGG